MVVDQVMRIPGQQFDGSGSSKENIRNSNVMVVDQVMRIPGTAM